MKTKMAHWFGKSNVRRRASLCIGLLASFLCAAGEVDYIESRGTGFFDTGVVPTPNTRFEVDYQYMTLPVSTDSEHGTILGWQGGNNQEAFLAIVNKNTPEQLQVNVCDTTAAQKLADSDLKRHVLYMSSGHVEQDGTLITPAITKTLGDGHSVYLFALHAGWAATAMKDLHHAKMRLYSCKVYEGADLIRDYVPYADGDDIGLYDRVAAKFHVLSAAQFMAGEVSSYALPLDENGNWKEEVPYVEADCGTCYFDTGVKVKPTTRVLTCVAFTAWPAHGAAIGGGGYPNVATLVFSPSDNTSGNVWRTNVSGDWQNPGWTNSPYKADKAFHVWDLKSGSQRIDGLPIATTTIAADAVARCNFILGGRQVAFNGSTTPDTQFQTGTKMRIRSCQIYDGTTLVKDYVADYRNGQYGLFDKVSQTFCTATKGAFTGVRGKAPIYVEYVETTCVDPAKLYQGLDTGIRPTENTRIVADMAFTTSSSYGSVMGSGGMGVTTFLFGPSWGDKWQWEVGGTRSTTTGGTKDSLRHKWDLQSGSQKIDGKEYTQLRVPAGTATGNSFRLFARDVGSGSDPQQPERIWVVKLYDGSALLRDFKPCYLNSRFCLKDEVTGQYFYTTAKDEVNAALGVCDLKGPALDVPYEKMAYVKTDGSQFVDTRFKSAPAMRILAKMGFVKLTGTAQMMGWCGNANYVGTLLGATAQGYFGGAFANTYSTLNEYTLQADTNIHEWEFVSGSQKIDGVTYGTQELTVNTTGDGYTFYLFARHRGWALSDPDMFMQVKMYGCKIWLGDALRHDYIPVVIGGRACLYDLVGKLPLFSAVGNEMQAGKIPGMMIMVR